jgi:hypothetical protein
MTASSWGKLNEALCSVVEANFKLYRKSTTVTAHREFPERTHYTLG